MSQTISEKINPNRIPREPLGLKAESILNRITLNPSSARSWRNVIYKYSKTYREFSDCTWKFISSI